MDKTYIVGIDPGKRGAIALINKDTLEAKVFVMPQYTEELIQIISSYKEKILFVAIEKQQPFPKQGVVSTFKIGMHYGMILGILNTLQIPYEEISPRKWQKEMIGNGKKKRKISKELSLKKAKALFPKVDIGKHDGKSDALLIAEYARRTILQNIQNG